MLALVLRKSDKLADIEAITQSWFEDDPQVVQALEGARGRDRTKLAGYLLQSVIARRSVRWAEVFCARPYGCARRLQRPICVGANSRLLRKRSPTDGI